MYIYIFEDGIIQVHPDEPTKADLSCIKNGTLMVLKCDSVHNVLEDKSLVELESCIIETHDGKDWHVPN